MVFASHHDRRSKTACFTGDSVVVRGDYKPRNVSSFGRSFIDVLKDGFTGEKSERFTWESGGGVPGGNYTQN
jgi:hypothetical protein